jgi:hypothetical protein
VIATILVDKLSDWQRTGERGKADISRHLPFVRFRGQSGHLMLRSGFSGFDRNDAG